MEVCFRKVCTFMSQQKSWRKVLGWLSSTSIIGIFSSTVTRSFSSSVNKREARYTPLTEKMRDKFFLWYTAQQRGPHDQDFYNNDWYQPIIYPPNTHKVDHDIRSLHTLFLDIPRESGSVKMLGHLAFHSYPRRVECLIIYRRREGSLSVARLPPLVYR